MASCELRYYSSALGKQTTVNILIPDISKEQVGTPLPTLYLLHGLGDDHQAWLRNSSLERYHSQLKTPMVIVLPDGGRSFYANGVHGDAYEDAIAVELVERIERTFPVSKERSDRGLAGLSMGGHGAIRFALRFPDRFCAAASLSGATNFGHDTLSWDGNPFPDFMQRIIGDNPVGGQSDLYALAEKLPIEHRPALFIDCGTEDFLINHNREFHAHLLAHQFPHRYIERPGAHNWEYWDTYIRDSITFVQAAMASAATSVVPITQTTTAVNETATAAETV